MILLRLTIHSGHSDIVQDLDEMVYSIAQYESNRQKDLVTLDAMHTGACGSVPVSLVVLYERPHETPRDDCSEQYGQIHQVRTDHTSSYICHAEVEVKSVIYSIQMLRLLYVLYRCLKN